MSGTTVDFNSLGVTYGDTCSYEIASFPDFCKSPFIPAAAVTSPFSVDLGSSTKMPLTSYTWTSDDGSCNSITAAIQGTGSTATSSLVLSNTATGWMVEPTDYNTV